MRDLYDRYLRGASDLLKATEPASKDYLKALTLRSRLAQAIFEV